MFTLKRILRKIKLLNQFVQLRLSRKSFERIVDYQRLRRDCQALASRNQVTLVPIGQILLRLSNEKVNRYSFTPVMSGDWDLNCRPMMRLALSSTDEEQHLEIIDDGTFGNHKLSGILEHFHDGVPWIETQLFQHYAKRFETELLILRCRDMQQMEAKYVTVYETLYRSLKENGFQSSHPVSIYIGRNGDYLFGSGGNHRLAMAIALGIPLIPVRVVSRHTNWQNIREQVFQSDTFPEAYLHLMDHPDLQDLRKPAH